MAQTGDNLERLIHAILESQQEQLALTEELIELQRKQLELTESRHARAEAINERAEALQAKQANLLIMGRRATYIILPVVAFLILVIIIILSRLNLL